MVPKVIDSNADFFKKRSISVGKTFSKNAFYDKELHKHNEKLKFLRFKHAAKKVSYINYVSNTKKAKAKKRKNYDI